MKIKPQFLTPLDVRSLGDGDEWELIGDLVYESRILKGRVTVPAGTKTNFASVPKWTPIAYTMLKSVGKPAATVHDYLYKTRQHNKFTCDRVFKESLKAIKVPMWKRNVMYWAVVVFGFKAYVE
jgi:hypothetical protein